MRIKWKGPKRDIIIDIDGSFTAFDSTKAPYYLTPYYPHLLDTAKGCKRDDTESKLFGDAVICPSAASIKEIMFYLPAPGSTFNQVFMKILRVTDTKDIEQAIESDFTSSEQIATWGPDTPQAWGMPFVTNNIYNIHWARGLDFDFLPFRASPEWNSNEKIILR